MPRAPGATSAVASALISPRSMRCGSRIEGVEPHVAAAHQLEGDRRAQEPDGGAHAGVGRDDHAINAELFGDARGMQRRTAAEGDQIVRLTTAPRSTAWTRAAFAMFSETISYMA